MKENFVNLFETCYILHTQGRRFWIK